MIRFLYILLFIFLGNCFSLLATEYLVAKDSINLGMIEYDQQEYANFKSQKKFDYYHQIKDDSWQWKKELERKFYDWLRDHFSPNLTKKQFDNFLIFGIVFFFILLIVLLYIYRPSLFYFNKKKKLKYEIEEEGLENADLNKKIKQALENEEYEEAIRWNYMKLLQILNEKEFISFDSNKTVYEYVYEITRKDLRAAFKEISFLFTYYRYGNGVASLSIYEDFNQLNTNFLKRLESLS